MKKKSFYEKYIKRPTDIILSLLALLILSPILLITYFLVKKNLGSPAIYTQERTGKDCKTFTIYKFRTMTDEYDSEGCKLPDDVRLTSFGKKLRSTSIDELPQLYNILIGDMSFIGPRPQTADILHLYNEEQIRRHEVRPGLSGLAQINGRNKTTWTKRFEYDVEYIDNVTFLGDLKILLITIKKVLTREGIEGENTETMEKFNGYN